MQTSIIQRFLTTLKAYSSAQSQGLSSLVTCHSSLEPTQLSSLVTRHLSLIILLLLLASCKLTKPEYSTENQIKNTLYGISNSFNNKDLAPIMNAVHEDYSHNGMIKWNLRELWLDRMARYSLLEINVVQITFNGDYYATVTMVMDFQDAAGNLVLNEPWDSGDISYFYYNGRSWVICGNQFVP